MSESMAKDRGIAVSCGSFPLAANGRALATGCTDGLVKVVADKKTDQLLGVQVVARKRFRTHRLCGCSYGIWWVNRRLGCTIHAHPTLSESLKEAALVADGRGLHSL